MKKMVIIAVLAITSAIAAGAGMASQKPQGQDPASVDKGRRLFGQYCASCHGTDAKGRGPVAAALKKGPPDLTMIQAPGEKFPFYRVATVIDGQQDVTAHGSRKMPVWGIIFRKTDGDLLKEADIYALAKYVESIQTTTR